MSSDTIHPCLLDACFGRDVLNNRNTVWAGQAIITWATPTADDKLGVFERYEVEIAQIPYSKDPTDDNITFDVSDPSNLEWISVYSGPDVEVRFLQFVV